MIGEATQPDQKEVTDQPLTLVKGPAETATPQAVGESQPTVETAAGAAPPLLPPEPPAVYEYYFAEYGKQSSTTLEYILDKRKQELAEQNKDLFSMPAGEAAALLVAIESASTTSPEVTKQAPEQAAISVSQIDELKNRVLLDSTAADLYYQEVFSKVTPEVLSENIVATVTLLQTGEEQPNPVYLRKLVEAMQTRTTDLARVAQNNPDLETALNALEKEWSDREETIAEAARTVTAVVEEKTGDTTSGSEAAQTEVEATVTEGQAEVVATERVDEENLVVTTKDAAGNEVKTTVKQKNIWSLMVLMVLSDALLGSHNLEHFVQTLVNKHVLAPTLASFGINSEALFATFNKNDHDAFDGLFKVMDSRQAEQYFTDATEKNFLAATLEKMNPEHVAKIFNPDRTLAFGKTGFFDQDHLELPQELVDKMYDSLSERERRELKIPQRAAATTSTT